jgi:kynureninase
MDVLRGRNLKLSQMILQRL